MRKSFPRNSLIVAMLFLTAFVCTACSTIGSNKGDWRVYAAEKTSTKYSALGQINRKNAKYLQETWVWTSPDKQLLEKYNTEKVQLWPHAYESTPLMVDGMLFVSTSLSQVAAIDAATGETLWVYNPQSYLDPKSGEIISPPNLGFVQRGLAYWEQGRHKRLFFGTGAANLIALDAHTGKLVPDFGREGVIDLKQGLRRDVEQALYSVSSPPVVCGNTVVVGSSISDYPRNPQMPPGDVRGFDAVTGKLLWIFHTVPQPGEEGHQTWEDNAWQETGGANVWAPMSCDSKLHYVYLPVSTPSNDYYGGNRPGHGLFGDSLVALNAATGKLVWYFQMVHHGLWDYDPPAAPILMNLEIDGRKVKAVAQISKQGFVYVFNRVTGDPIWPMRERAVPQSTVPGERSALTQPFPTKPLPFDRQGLTQNDVIDFTPELRSEALELVSNFEYGPLFTPPALDDPDENGIQGTIFIPSNVGGGSWAGAAFHPVLNILYVPSVTVPAVIKLSEFPPNRFAGSISYPRLSNGLPITKPPYGRLTAIDMNTGEHLWARPVGRGPIDHPAIEHLGLKNLGWNRRSFFIATKNLLVGAQEGIIRLREEHLSPLTRLYVLHNHDAFLWALDLKTGEQLAEIPMRQGNATGSPMTYMAKGRQYIVVPVGGAGNTAKLVAYSLP